MEALLDRAREAIASADALLITAGAGMGVDSGLPDFRGNEGFWRAYPPMKALGYSFMEMASPRWFEDNPPLAWAFYGHRLHLYREVSPHKGFEKLLDLGRSKAGGYFVFTSNVDGHFQRAGFEGERLMECHGSIHHLQCSLSCTESIWSAGDVTVTIDPEHFEAIKPLPQCHHCGGIARPNILMFGDWGWQGQRTQGQEQRLQRWLHGIARKGERLVVIEVGAGEAVPTVRHTSEEVVQGLGGTLIRINPRDTTVPQGHISLPLGGLDGLSRLLDPL